MKSRRDFLKKIAKGAVYSVPVIKTIALPESLSAFNLSGMMGGMGGMGMGMGMGALRVEPAEPPGSTPPWQGSAPGSTPPGGGDSGGSE